MARFSRRQVGRSGSRPNRGWSPSLVFTAFTVLPANSFVFNQVLIPTNPGIDNTILRVVGELTISSDQTGASEEQVGAFGMILVTDSAVAIGVTALPDPSIDAGDDGWFVYQSFSQQTALNTIGVGSITYPIDSKAKRIVHGTGVNVAIMIANSHATQGLSFVITFRMLSQVRGTR